MSPVLRSAGLVAVLGLGAASIFLALHLHYPITEWLIWRYIGYTAASASWAASCMAIGLRLFDAFRFSDVERQERWVLAFALGVLVFGVSMFVLGFVKLWSSWVFVLLPAVFVVVGRVELSDALRALGSWLSRNATDRRALAWLALAAGLIGLLLVYIPILNPQNIGYDTRWYHFAVSEQHAVRGGIEPFTEASFNGAQPQFAAVIYGWAFLLPGGTLFDRIELGLHLELTLFVATLASVPVLARVLTGERQPYAWVLMLLFPGLYLYDSNLIGGADHIAAFWAVPVALVAYRAWRDFSPRSLVLAALIAAGPLLTKYTAVGLVLGPGLLLLARAVFVFFRSDEVGSAPSRASIIASLGAGLAAGLAVTAPHWLKNLVYYGDPVFPFLPGVFTDRTWVPNAALRLEAAMSASWKAERSLRGVLDTLAAPLSFAFWPHDWGRFHGKIPVFGFLYTVTMPGILFVPKRARIAVLYVVTSVGIMYWYWTFHQDRYLQAYLPWMAACVAGILSQAWSLGTPVRVSVALLIAAQVLVGAGVPFLPTHAMVGRSPFVGSIKLFGDWRSKKRANLDTPTGAFSNMSRELPIDAKLLLHDTRLTLGVGRPVVSDAIAWQLGIEYSEHISPSAMWQLLREHGVTHVAWKSRGGIGRSPIAADVAFYYFVNNHLLDVHSIDGFHVGALANEPPSDDGFFGNVAVLGCERQYDRGIYEARLLTATRFRRERNKKTDVEPLTAIESSPGEERPSALLAEVDAVRHEAKCFPLTENLSDFGFKKAHERKGVVLYVRTSHIEDTAP